MADGTTSQWPALLQLASSGLPIGGFSYSSGLEAAVDSGRVRDAYAALSWIGTQLDPLWATGDARLWLQAHAAWCAGDLARIQTLNLRALALRDTVELRLESTQMGRSLALWLLKLEAVAATLEPAVRAWLESGTAPQIHTVVHAAATRALGLSAREGLQALAWSQLEAQVSAAVRLVPLGQTAGQQLLQALGARLPAAIDRALAAPSEVRNFSPLLGIHSARHETQYSRLFRS